MAGPQDKSHDPCHDRSGVNPWDALGMIDFSQTICRYICKETGDETTYEMKIKFIVNCSFFFTYLYSATAAYSYNTTYIGLASQKA